MGKKAKSQPKSKRDIKKLAKVAFGNVLDFARFNRDGSVEIFDWGKAEDIGANVSVVTRKVGRGKTAREVRVTEIKMPNKLPALLTLLKYADRQTQKRR
jgi:hypothetical protein